MGATVGGVPRDTWRELALAHPRLGVDAARPLEDLGSAALPLAELAAAGWTPADIRAWVEDWPEITRLWWREPGLLEGLGFLAGLGLDPGECRVWLKALYQPLLVSTGPTAGQVMPTITRFAEGLARARPLSGAVAEYVQAAGGNGRLALLAAQAGLTPQETSERAQAGTLKENALALMAGLRGATSHVE